MSLLKTITAPSGELQCNRDISNFATSLKVKTRRTCKKAGVKTYM